MTRRELAWFFAAAVLALLAAISAPAHAQESETAAAAAEPAPEAPPEDDRRAAVEEILEKQEALMRGQRFAYDPEGRRDPFRSLYEQVRIRGKGPRPKGVAGMLVTEIDLTGIVRDRRSGDVAFFTGSDNKGYFLRVGDDVYDGTLIAIDARRGAVTFRQQVDDPRLIKPYRDVVKRLVPEESAND